MTDPGQPGTPPAGGPQPGRPVPPQGTPAGATPAGATPAGAWQPPAGGHPQPGQPGAWGPPHPGFGQPQPGFGQPQPGQPAFGQPGPFGSGQPGQPGPFGGPAPAPAGRPGKGRKIGSIVAAVAVAGGIAAFRLVDFGAPEVGDCMKQEGASSYDTVDCDDSEATLRVVGVEAEEVTESEFYDTDYIPCTEFENAVQAVWRGGDSGDGTVYCVEPV